MSFHILCVEPVGEICLLLGKMLPETKIVVEHVATMNEANEFLKEKQPALIIIDNHFAQTEICARVAAIKAKAPSSKLLMISAVDDEAADMARSAGVDRFLQKPFTKATLTDAVVSMLK